MAAERVVIVGAGGFGRELLAWAQDCQEAGLLPPPGGFVDDDAEALAGYDCPVGHLSSIDAYHPDAGDLLLIAIGEPSRKRQVAERLIGRGGRFATLIHPTAVVSRSARLEEGVVLCPLSLVSAGARVGRLAIVNTLSSVGHDVVVGDYSTLSAHVDLTGFASLGEEVLVGSGARLLPKVKVGDGAVVGAGAIVYRSIPARATVYATPAKLMAER